MLVHRARAPCSCSHNAEKYGYFGPFVKNRAQPKTRQKGDIFSMMHVVYPLTYQKIPFNAPVFILRSKVELNWTSAIRA